MSEHPRLPEAFSDLQELADRFAISDDLQRQTFTENATTEEQRILVDTIWPRFDAINAYLDDHDDEPAHLLGRLAEAACEVSIEIGYRPSV